MEKRENMGKLKIKIEDNKKKILFFIITSISLFNTN